MFNTYVENFYTGGSEFIIFYKNGTHVIYSCDDDEEIFEGSYEKCLAFKHILETDYQMSLF